MLGFSGLPPLIVSMILTVDAWFLRPSPLIVSMILTVDAWFLRPSPLIVSMILTVDAWFLRPSPLIVSMILTVEGGTKVEEVLKIILKAIKEKKLVSSIDGNIETYKLDPLGFQFITPDKTDLVCGAGHDYDVTWGLTMFSNHDYQLCPRGAAGT